MTLPNLTLLKLTIFIIGFICFAIYSLRVMISIQYSIYWYNVMGEYEKYCDFTGKERDVTFFDIIPSKEFIWQLTNFDKNTLLPKEKLNILKECRILED